MPTVVSIEGFHYQDERSDKVWGFATVQEDSGEVTTFVCFGRRGSNLQLKEYQRGLAYGQGKAREKRGKGYLEINPADYGISSRLSRAHRAILKEVNKRRQPRQQPAEQTRPAVIDSTEPSPSTNQPEVKPSSGWSSGAYLGSGIVVSEDETDDK